MLSDVLDDVPETLFHFFVEILLFFAGEIVLFLVTFGRKKPRWDHDDRERPSRWVVLTTISVYVGFFFRVLAIRCLAWLAGTLR